jgi:hypothetical protein
LELINLKTNIESYDIILLFGGIYLLFVQKSGWEKVVPQNKEQPKKIYQKPMAALIWLSQIFKFESLVYISCSTHFRNVSKPNKEVGSL